MERHYTGAHSGDTGGMGGMGTTENGGYAEALREVFEERTVQLALPSRELTTEVTGDFTLPDYQPEIKRLLRIGVNLLPPTPFTEGDRTELTGSMDYYVLYQGQDGGVYCAPLSTEYRLEVKEEGRESLPPMMGAPVYLCDLFSDVPVGRVLSPRRLQLRCRVRARLGGYGECPLKDPGEEDPSTERLHAETTVGRLYQGLSEPLTLRDDIILSPADGPLRVVCAEGQVMITEASPSSGMVSCRGEVSVKLTLSPIEREEGLPPVGDAPLPALPLTILRRKLPFSQIVDVEGVTSDCKTTARGYCTEISVLMEEGQLHVEMGMICHVRARKSQSIPFVKDLYSIRRQETCHYATYPIELPLRALNGNFTLSDSLPLSEVGIDPAARLLDVTATALPQALTTDPDRGRCILTGQCTCHLLLQKQEDYASAELTLPFRYEFDDPGLMKRSESCSTVTFDGGISVIHCRGRMDGERVGVDAELAVSLCTHAVTSFTALSAMTLGEELPRRGGEYVICFPSPTDTVWSVAKRYHAPMALLTAVNDLPTGVGVDKRESLTGVGYLIV